MVAFMKTTRSKASVMTMPSVMHCMDILKRSRCVNCWLRSSAIFLTSVMSERRRTRSAPSKKESMR